jgi:hypothetical protein
MGNKKGWVGIILVAVVLVFLVFSLLFIISERRKAEKAELMSALQALYECEQNIQYQPDGEYYWVVDSDYFGTCSAKYGCVDEVGRIK